MHPLDGAFLKFTRSEYHFHTLQASIERWKNGNPYEFVSKTEINDKATSYLILVKELSHIPTDLSLMVGDVCNNARSALDYALWQLWLLQNPAFDRNVTFPIFDTFDAGDGKHGFKFEATRRIRDLTENKRTFIEGCQPYKTGDKSLSILRDLNNSDKHRLIQLFALKARAEGGTIEKLKGKPSSGYIHWRLAERVEVKDGAVLAQFDFDPSLGGDNMKVHVDFSFVLAFRGSKTADGLTVVDTLQHCISTVHEILLKSKAQFFV